MIMMTSIIIILSCTMLIMLLLSNRIARSESRTRHRPWVHECWKNNVAIFAMLARRQSRNFKPTKQGRVNRSKRHLVESAPSLSLFSMLDSDQSWCLPWLCLHCIAYMPTYCIPAWPMFLCAYTTCLSLPRWLHYLCLHCHASSVASFFEEHRGRPHASGKRSMAISHNYWCIVTVFVSPLIMFCISVCRFTPYQSATQHALKNYMKMIRCGLVWCE